MQLPSNPNHPIWACVRFCVGIIAVTVVLWSNASDFDITEAQSIATIAALLGGGLWGERKLFQQSPKQETE